MLWALPVVLSHRPQWDVRREHPSADDKRLMMSGPQAFFLFFSFFLFSFEALPLQWEGEWVMLLAFVAAHVFSGTFSPQQWHVCVMAARCLCSLSVLRVAVSVLLAQLPCGEGWADPGEATSCCQL